MKGKGKTDSRAEAQRPQRDQTKRMAEILRLTEAIKRSEQIIENHQDVVNRAHVKLMRQQTELRLQKIILKWYLP